MSKRRKITEGQWSADEVRLLKKLLPKKRVSEIAEKLGRSADAVRRKRYSIGIRYPHRLWSEREIKLVKKLFPDKGPKVIARKIGRSAATVSQKAYAMGLKRIGLRPYHHWSADEARLLKKLLPKKKLREIGKRLGRSAETVRAKARKMGLRDGHSRPCGRLWTEKEIKLVKKLFPSKGPHEVAGRLGRSVGSVKQRAYKMGLTKEGFRHWSADEIRLLKKVYPNHLDSKQLAKRLGRPLSAVRQRAYDMGLTKEKR